jgi:hypothetical protein
MAYLNAYMNGNDCGVQQVASCQTYEFESNLDIPLLSALGTCLFAASNITTSDAYRSETRSVTMHSYPYVCKENCSLTQR